MHKPSPTKIPKHQSQAANLGFISDSMFKFLVEDQHSQQFIIEHHCKQNIRIFSGYKSTDISQLVCSQTLQEFSQQHVDKLAVSIGAVDLLKMNDLQQTPQHVAHTVATAITQIATEAKKYSIALLTVIRGQNICVTEAQLTEFTN